MMDVPVLEIKNLAVSFTVPGRDITAVDGVNLTVGAKETIVIAGESGSGKTVTALAVTRLLPRGARVVSGEIYFLGRDLASRGEDELRAIRGKEIAYVFQEPAAYLNPVYTIGEQIAEAVIFHQGLARRQAYTQAQELMRMVKIAEPQRVLKQYPHQLSGGMNQRVFIAMAVACRPKLLIADEPTTALDVTVEREILSLLGELKESLGFALIFITHNLSIARRIADRICVMHRGRIVEEGDIRRIFDAPVHAHTQALVAAYERIGRL